LGINSEQIYANTVHVILSFRRTEYLPISYLLISKEATAGNTAYFLSPVAVKPSGMQLSESSIMSPPKLYKTVQIFRIPGFP